MEILKSLISGIGIPNALLAGGVITIMSAIWFERRRKFMRKSVRHIYMSKGIISSLPAEQ
ncbi:MAG: hypothetical protein JXQ80_07305 [Bacteroidales bacterium]|nr:hypothetical protein [Bacteroidales bacterium]